MKNTCHTPTCLPEPTRSSASRHGLPGLIAARAEAGLAALGLRGIAEELHYDALLDHLNRCPEIDSSLLVTSVWDVVGASAGGRRMAGPAEFVSLSRVLFLFTLITSSAGSGV